MSERILYSHADIERLVAEWDQGWTFETIDARADFLRARATLREDLRIALHYTCCGYSAQETAKLMLLSRQTVTKLVREAKERMLHKMNGGHV